MGNVSAKKVVGEEGDGRIGGEWETCRRDAVQDLHNLLSGSVKKGFTSILK